MSAVQMHSVVPQALCDASSLRLSMLRCVFCLGWACLRICAVVKEQYSIPYTSPKKGPESAPWGSRGHVSSTYRPQQHQGDVRSRHILSHTHAQLTHTRTYACESAGARMCACVLLVRPRDSPGPGQFLEELCADLPARFRLCEIMLRQRRGI